MAYRSTRQERAIYDKAFKQAVKEANEKFSELNNDNMDTAMEFRDRRLHEILLAASSPQVGALRILEQKQAAAQREAERSAAAREAERSVRPRQVVVQRETKRLVARSLIEPAPSPTTKQDNISDDLLIGAQSIAKELGISPHRVYYLVRCKQLPIGHLGKKTLIASKAKLRRFFQDLT